MADELQISATDDEATCTIDVDVASGARVARVRVERGGESVDLLAQLPDATEPWSTGWGCFVMAPWAGRLRHGRFSFDGRDIGLALNHRDGSGTGGGAVHPAADPPDGDLGDDVVKTHAIHGTVFNRTWVLDNHSGDACTLHCPLDGRLGWDLGGVARQTIRVRPSGATFELTVEATEGQSFPAAIGWHPWFSKPDRLELTPTAMYQRDDSGLPTGVLVDASPPPWDDCFTNRAPVRLRYDRKIAPAVTVRSDCDHLVIYDLPEHATCVEPQSGPPDAFNLRPDVVTAGHPLRRTMTWSW